MDLDKFLQRRIDRRKLLKSAGLAGVGAALGGTGLSTALAQGSANLDPKILTFALNLEYLEAEFYLQAAYGLNLSSEDIGSNPGKVVGGSKVKFSTPAIEEYAQEIAGDEEAHVQFLRAALGSSAVSRPEINFTDAFTTAAIAAGVIHKGQTFNPFANELFFLHGAFIFEDVGVTAYHGAAPFITDKDTVLAAAAGILGTEAYHASEVRTLLYQHKDVKAVGDQTVAQVVQKISDARDLLDGSGDDDQGIVMNHMANIVPTDKNGIVYARTPKQVLNIVYLDLSGNAKPGGFFPKGLNGDFSGVPSL
jgi:hypothetical protein